MILASAATVIPASSTVLRPAHPGQLRACSTPVRRATAPQLTGSDSDYDWDAAWRRRVAADGQPEPVTRAAEDPLSDLTLADGERERGGRSQAATANMPNVNTVLESLRKPVAQAVDVRQWRLPFGLFTFMRKTDFFGTALAVSTLAWILFYLAVVPATYMLGPALGLPDVSGLDTQSVARIVFLPGWPACLVVAAGVMLLRQGEGGEE